MNNVKVLVFAGSLRKESYNKKLAKVAASAVEAAGATVRLVELNEYPLPFMDEDLEAREGVPEEARAFKALMKEHDAFIIASPEYNGSFSGVLKNTIDWCSRKEDGESVLACYKDKVIALLAASPGNLGGMRGLTQLRTLLSGMGSIVLPSQITVGKASEAFNTDGSMCKDKQQENIEKLVATVIDVTAKLKSQ